jgi:hypothetical protein
MKFNDPRNLNNVSKTTKVETFFRVIGWDDEGGRYKVFQKMSSMDLALSKIDTMNRMQTHGEGRDWWKFDNYDVLKETVNHVSSAFVIEPSDYPDRTHCK